MLVERPSMGIADVSNEQTISSLAAAVLILSSLSLGECAASSGVSLSMDARAQAAPPKTGIFDSPPKREQPAMTPQQQLNLQNDLTAARDRHAPDAKAGAHAAPPDKPVKP
jgi:hypothetical protein